MQWRPQRGILKITDLDYRELLASSCPSVGVLRQSSYWWATSVTSQLRWTYHRPRWGGVQSSPCNNWTLLVTCMPQLASFPGSPPLCNLHVVGSKVTYNKNTHPHWERGYAPVTFKWYFHDTFNPFHEWQMFLAWCPVSPYHDRGSCLLRCPHYTPDYTPSSLTTSH